MRIPDVVGTGVGIGPDGLPAIKVFTKMHGVKGIPEWLESTPVHVEVSGRFYALRGETCDTKRRRNLHGLGEVAATCADGRFSWPPRHHRWHHCSAGH